MGFLLLFSGSDTEKVSPWKKIRESNGISIYSRTNSLSPIKEVKAEMEISTSLGGLVTLVKDVKNQPKWAYSNIEARILEQKDIYHWINYTLSDVPWPASDRYVIAEVELWQNADSSVYVLSRSSDRFPDYNTEAVRIPLLRTSWYFKKRKNGKIFVRIQILLDPGGSIPAWITNLFVDKGPYNTVYNLRQMVEKEEYKKIRLPYIKE